MSDHGMRMRPSRVLATMRAGGVATCVKLNLSDARAAEIAALCGFDCVWTDREHCPNTLHDIENQVRAALMHGADVVVRVERGSYSDLVHPLEMGATGIMVPHCMSAEDARKIAWYTKFHPVGRRPVDSGNADGAYAMIPMADYMEQSNRERFVIVQIEDPEPLEELDAIAAVEGIDMLLFGATDFSHGIGAPGQYDHPRVRDARQRVVEAARRHGKFAGAAGSVASFGELAAMGYQFINVGSDVVSLAASFRTMTAALKDA